MRCIRPDCAFPLGATTMTYRIIGVYSGRSRPAVFESEERNTAYQRSAWDGPAPVTVNGIEDDELADSRRLGRRNHALYLFSRAHYQTFGKMLGRELPEAAFAENIAYDGPDETELRIGDVLSVGDVTVRITTPRVPCYKLRHFLNAPQGFPPQFSATGKTGFYVSVLNTGLIRAGDEIQRISTDAANVTVAELNEAMTGFTLEPDLIERVLGSPDLLPGAAEIIRERIARYRPEIAVGPGQGRITNRTNLSPDTAVIEIHLEDSRKPDWQPGQFITLGLPDSSGSCGYRCYSLIAGPSAANPDAPYSVAVRATDSADPDASVSTRLVRSDVIGREVVVYPPSGDFTLPDGLVSQIVFLAGGIGITPILSQLRSLLKGPPGPDVLLIYVSKTQESAVFADELARLAASRDDFEFELWLTGGSGYQGPEYQKGRPDIDSLIQRTSESSHIYVCGPIGMIEAARQSFAATGRPNTSLHFELFEAPPRDGDTKTPEMARIILSGADIDAEWVPGDGTLLEWIEAHSAFRPPAACRSGLCRTCQTTLDKGTVVYPAGIASPEPGSVLLCCARPSSEIVEVGLPAGTERRLAPEKQELPE